MTKNQKAFIKDRLDLNPNDIPETVVKAWWKVEEVLSDGGMVDIRNAKLRLLHQMKKHGEKFEELWDDTTDY